MGCHRRKRVSEMFKEFEKFEELCWLIPKAQIITLNPNSVYTSIQLSKIDFFLKIFLLLK